MVAAFICITTGQNELFELQLSSQIFSAIPLVGSSIVEIDGFGAFQLTMLH
jgi:hypothetical protein